MAQTLQAKHCGSCEGGESPATDAEIAKLLAHVPQWRMHEEVREGKTVKTLQRRLRFDTFRAAMAFLRRVETIAETEGHHPDFCVHFNKVDFILWTHALGGLHENDFILAAKIDEARRIS